MSELTELTTRPGEVLAGKYRVEKVLGAGAMGVILAARHIELDELRAIKLLRPSLLGDRSMTERFMREARAAVRLKSEHVAKVHDVGKLESGAPFIVMEYLEGNDLKSFMGGKGRTLDPEVAASFVLQACEALSEAHAAGIIHRDLKPSNLFVSTSAGGTPCVKVLDFGIAKLAAQAGASPQDELTGTMDILGTPLYMSPEQMRSARTVDARSDIWALGAILYRCLVGRTPFRGHNTAEICVSVMTEEPVPLSSLRPDVPPGLEAIVLKCLEKDPDRRYGSAAELADALVPYAGSGAAASRRISALDFAPRSTDDMSAVRSRTLLSPLAPGSDRTGRASNAWLPAHARQAEKPARSKALIGASIALVAAATALGLLYVVEPSDSAGTSTQSGDPSSQPRTAMAPTAGGDSPVRVEPVGSTAPAVSAPGMDADGGAPQDAGAAARPTTAPPPPQKLRPTGQGSSPKVGDAFGNSRK